MTQFHDIVLQNVSILESTSETVKPDGPDLGRQYVQVQSIARRAMSRRGGLAVFVFGVGKEGQVLIFQAKVARPRNETVRAGWNDAAWRRPHRQVEVALARSYDREYAGGLRCREKQQADLLKPAIVSSAIAETRAGGLSGRPSSIRMLSGVGSSSGS